MRLLMMAVLALAPALVAQTSVNLTGNVAEARIHYYMFDVDHGSTPTAIDFTVDLTATGTDGLDVTVYDLNEWAGLGPVYDATDFVFPSGQVIVTLSLPSRTGVHQVLVALEIDDFDGATPYTGTAAVSAGAIAQADFVNAQLDQAGIQNIFDRLVYFLAQSGNAGQFFIDLALDFGPTSHSANLKVGIAAAGTGVQYRLLDMSTTPPTVVATATGGASLLIDERAFSIGPHTGAVTYRVELTNVAVSGLVSSEIVIGSDLTLTNTTALTTNVVKKKESNDCSVSAGAGWPGAAALGVLGAFGLARRKRKSGNLRCVTAAA